jgi:hypothetical protein
MFFLNLGLGEFMALFTAISAGVVALYLLDRSRRKQTVATLKFWRPAEMPSQQQQRRRISQPWSMLLQILGILLLLLALAGVRIGQQFTQGAARDHVLILDSSAWMGARMRQGTLMDDARAQARAWLKTIPSTDRVMVVRADAVASPVTRFETNRGTIEKAIRETQPGAAALNLGEALRFAQQTGGRGEIVLATAGRIAPGELPATFPPNLRVLNVTGPYANVGLRKIGLLRSVTDPEAWEIFVTAKNYGPAVQNVTLALQFAGTPVGSRQLALKPMSEQESTFLFKTRAAGLVEARLLSAGDAFPQDDRASFELPNQRQLRVAVYSAEPALLKPLLASNPNVSAVFLAPSAYGAPQPPKTEKPDVVILDRFAPPAPPDTDAIWIEPPALQSPVPVASNYTKVKVTKWTSDPVLGAGLHTHDLELDSSIGFRTAPNDIAVASVDAGPVVVARPGKHKTIVMGFHPERSRVKYELAAPLLFANVLRWLAPESFLRWQLTGGNVGNVTVKLAPHTDPAQVRVLGGDGGAIPYTIDGDSLRFFASDPGTVRVLTGERELVYSLTVPEVGDTTWQIPTNVRRGVPRRTPIEAVSTDIWYWLALAGAACLLAEWIIYGRHKTRLRAMQASRPAPMFDRKAS